ncbi:hypothetical protein L4D06_19745 [Enterovibrio makurazakiensis]|uniref:hypothetical protein n=1 Tax=Enterovibrio makurazakiensis TaxID=2910232 RepID=UPI003D2179BF
MEEHLAGLRKIKQRHNNLHSLKWPLFSLFLLSSVAAVAIPPFAILNASISITIFVLYWRLATAECPRCGKRFYSLLQIAIGRMRVEEAVGSVKCCHCGLKMSELPEINETEMTSHTDEWR